MALDPAAIDRLVLAVGDDGRDVVAELVATFLAEAPLRLADLRRGVASGDGREAGRPVHSLKSAAATLGALDLAELCRTAEALSRAGDLVAVGGLVPGVGPATAPRRALEAAVR